MTRTLPRRSAIGLVLMISALLAPSPASANCTGLPASVSEVADVAKIIVVGRVVTSRFEGTAYDIQVDQVITGDVAVGPWSFGPTADPGSRDGTCLADPMPVGQRVVLSISRAPVADDHSFVDYFWWPVTADGRVGLISSGQTETTLSALLRTLHGGLPATDTATIESSPASISFPLAIVLALLGISRVTGGWWLRRGVEPERPSGDIHAR